MELSEKLKELRLGSGQSLQQVADAVGASKAHIWDMEAGRSSNPSLDLLRKLADNFRISVSNLIGETLVDTSLELILMHNDLKMLSESERELVNDVVDAMKARRRRRISASRSTSPPRRKTLAHENRC